MKLLYTQKTKKNIELLDKKVTDFANIIRKKHDAQLILMIPVKEKIITLTEIIIPEIIKGLTTYFTKKSMILIVGEETGRIDIERMYMEMKNYLSALHGNDIALNINIELFIKDGNFKGKSWSLRVGMVFGSVMHSQNNEKQRTFFCVDADIQNFNASWLYDLMNPLLNESDTELVFPTYSIRDYKGDERMLKDHFISPFMSAITNKRIREAEGEYGMATGKLMNTILDSYYIWESDIPEFYFIPMAIALDKKIKSVNFERKEHEKDENSLERINKYFKTMFDLTFTFKWKCTGDLEELTPISKGVIELDKYINYHPQYLFDIYCSKFQEELKISSYMREILSDEIFRYLQEITLLKKIELKRKLLGAEMWAKIIFLFLKQYRSFLTIPEYDKESEHYDSFFRILSLPFILRIMSFIYQMEGKTFDDYKSSLDYQTDCFIKERNDYINERLLSLNENCMGSLL